ncbi:MAG: hypothetical protein B7X40_01670, partial [Cellulomonas sp. 14-74-6]
MPQRPDDDADAGEPDQAAVDARWAQIVAELADLDAPAAPNDLPGDPLGAESRETGAAQEQRATDGHDPLGPAELAGRDWDGTAQQEAAEAAVDAAEHFVPPDPGPVLGGDPLLTLAWTATIGVPVLFVVLVLAWPDAPGWVLAVAAAVFAAGLAVLV